MTTFVINISWSWSSPSLSSWSINCLEWQQLTTNNHHQSINQTINSQSIIINWSIIIMINQSIILRAAVTRNGPRNIDLCYFLGQVCVCYNAKYDQKWFMTITITIMIYLYDHDHDTFVWYISMIMIHLIKDIFTSHVRCNPNWADGSNEGVKR